MEIDDIEPLIGLQNLRVLILDGFSRVVKVDPLGHLPKLENALLNGFESVLKLEPLVEARRLRRVFLGGFDEVVDVESLILSPRSLRVVMRGLQSSKISNEGLAVLLQSGRVGPSDLEMFDGEVNREALLDFVRGWSASRR